MDERSDKSFLGTEPLGRLMAHFAVPTIVAQTVGLLHNIVDRVFTGRIAGIGADALTGVGIAPPYHADRHVSGLHGRKRLSFGIRRARSLRGSAAQPR